MTSLTLCLGFRVTSRLYVYVCVCTYVERIDEFNYTFILLLVNKLFSMFALVTRKCGVEFQHSTRTRILEGVEETKCANLVCTLLYPIRDIS